MSDTVRVERRSMAEAAYDELKRKILRAELAPGAQFLEKNSASRSA
jgi:DNA-binding GntR family transcriptional regulator